MEQKKTDIRGLYIYTYIYTYIYIYVCVCVRARARLCVLLRVPVRSEHRILFNILH
jgi:hypothetical protein